MSKIPLTLAISHYDHVTELMNGRVPVEGVDLTPLNLQIEEIFFRMFNHRDFDASEVSMGKFSSLASQGNSPFVGIPVFPSRVCRHSSIYIRKDGSVKQPSDLKGKRVGIPEWAQTASVYSRGLLQHQYGVDLEVDRMGAGRRRSAGPAGEGEAQSAGRDQVLVRRPTRA